MNIALIYNYVLDSPLSSYSMLAWSVTMWSIHTQLLPRAHAQIRGKVIGSVVVVVVVVSTKIARSRILGEFTSATCS